MTPLRVPCGQITIAKSYALAGKYLVEAELGAYRPVRAGRGDAAGAGESASAGRCEVSPPLRIGGGLARVSGLGSAAQRFAPKRLRRCALHQLGVDPVVHEIHRVLVIKWC